MDKESPLIAKSLESLHWLAGNWSGTIKGDKVEENWSAGQGGQMMMNFRWLRDGKPLIYEFGILGAWDGEIELRLRHLRPDGVSIEARDATTVLRLLRIEGQEATFIEAGKSPATHLIYQRTGEEMRVWFEVDSGDPPVTGTFEYSLRK